MARQAPKIEQQTYEELVAEYERHKRETIGRRERAGDWLGGVDERLDFLAPKVFETLSDMEQVKAQLDEIQAVIGGGIVEKTVEQIPYFFVLAIPPAVGSAVRLFEVAPFSGYVRNVQIHWPPGANALVDVMVGHDNVQFCPREGYLALDAATPEYPCNEWVEDHHEIWVEMRNRDLGFTHAITVTVRIEKP